MKTRREAPSASVSLLKGKVTKDTNNTNTKILFVLYTYTCKYIFVFIFVFYYYLLIICLSSKFIINFIMKHIYCYLPLYYYIQFL